MITLQMIHETINWLRGQAAELHQDTLCMSDDDLNQWAYEDHATWPLDGEPPREGTPDFAVLGYAARRAECARLAMAWHDVVRGCRTDEDLHMRLAEHELDAVVRAFAADREAAA